MRKLNRITWVETSATEFERGERAILIGLDPAGNVLFRLKRTRRVYRIPIRTAFMFAVRLTTV